MESLLKEQFERIDNLITPQGKERKEKVIKDSLKDLQGLKIKKEELPVFTVTALIYELTKEDLLNEDWTDFIYYGIEAEIGWLATGRFDTDTEEMTSFYKKAQKELDKKVISLSLKKICKDHSLTQNEFEQRFKGKKLIGSGAFGKVYLTYDKEREQNVALKILTFKGMPDVEAEKDLKREVKIMKEVSSVFNGCNRYIVCLYDWFCLWPSKDEKWTFKFVIVMEYVKGTLLNEYQIKSKKEGLKIMKQVARGIADMHEEGVIHMDLHKANIMISNGKAKIIDFGISCSTAKTCSKIASDLFGDPTRPPEFFNHKINLNLETFKKSDVYMLGKIYQYIIDEVDLSKYQSLVDRMLSGNPRDRPTVFDVLEELK